MYQEGLPKARLAPFRKLSLDLPELNEHGTLSGTVDDEPR